MEISMKEGAALLGKLENQSSNARILRKKLSEIRDDLLGTFPKSEEGNERKEPNGFVEAMMYELNELEEVLREAKNLCEDINIF